MSPEEIIMNLYNPGLGGGLSGGQPYDDPRRRRAMAGGQQGLGGSEQGLARLLPFLMGAQFQNMSGFPGNQNFSGASQFALNNPMAQGNVAPAAPGGQSINQPAPPPSFAVNQPPPPSTGVQFPGAPGKGGGGGGLIDILMGMNGGGF